MTFGTSVIIFFAGFWFAVADTRFTSVSICCSFRRGRLSFELYTWLGLRTSIVSHGLIVPQLVSFVLAPGCFFWWLWLCSCLELGVPVPAQLLSVCHSLKAAVGGVYRGAAFHLAFEV